MYISSHKSKTKRINLNLCVWMYAEYSPYPLVHTKSKSKSPDIFKNYRCGLFLLNLFLSLCFSQRIGCHCFCSVANHPNESSTMNYIQRFITITPFIRLLGNHIMYSRVVNRQLVNDLKENNGRFVFFILVFIPRLATVHGHYMRFALCGFRTFFHSMLIRSNARLSLFHMIFVSFGKVWKKIQQ